MMMADEQAAARRSAPMPQIGASAPCGDAVSRRAGAGASRRIRMIHSSSRYDRSS